jgi:O-antigen/teichoic acid export membrane protein
MSRDAGRQLGGAVASTPPSGQNSETRGPQSSPGKLRTFGKETIAYGLSSGLAALAGVLVLPFITDELNPAQYGLFATATVLVQLMWTLSSLGLDYAAALWFNDNRERRWRGGIMTTWLAAQLGFSALLAAGVALLAGHYAPLISDLDEAPQVFIVASLLIPLGCIRVVASGYQRFRRKAVAAAVYLGTSTVVSMIGMITFARWLGGSATSVVWGQVAAAVLSAIWGVVILTRIVRPQWFSLQQLRRMLIFGLPILPAALASWTSQFSDRFILGLLDDTSAVGIYAVAVVASTPMILLLAAIQLAYAPFAFSEYQNPDSGKLFAALARWVTWFTCFGAALVAVCAPFLVRLLSQPSYYEGASAVPYLAFGQAALIIMTMYSLGTNLARTTVPIAVILISAAVINVGLNIALIPYLGIEGAAIATLAANCIAVPAMYIASQRRYRIPYTLRELVQFVVAAVVLVLLAQLITSDGWQGLLLRLALVLLMILLPMVNGMVDWKALREKRMSKVAESPDMELDNE